MNLLIASLCRPWATAGALAGLLVGAWALRRWAR